MKQMLSMDNVRRRPGTSTKIPHAYPYYYWADPHSIWLPFSAISTQHATMAEHMTSFTHETMTQIHNNAPPQKNGFQAFLES